MPETNIISPRHSQMLLGRAYSVLQGRQGSPPVLPHPRTHCHQSLRQVCAGHPAHVVMRRPCSLGAEPNPSRPKSDPRHLGEQDLQLLFRCPNKRVTFVLSKYSLVTYQPSIEDRGFVRAKNLLSFVATGRLHCKTSYELVHDGQ